MKIVPPLERLLGSLSGPCEMASETEVMGPALAGVAQCIECWPANPRVAGSIPSQDTCLGFGPGPQWGMHKRQPHIDVSLPLFLPPFPYV